MTTIAAPSPSADSTSNASQTTVADAIEQTLEWLDRQSGESTHERRNTRRGRYRVAAHIIYQPPGEERTRSFDVSTRNLSRTGLSFIHRTLIYPRQIVDVELPLPDRSVRHMRGRVIRVRPAGVGLYEIAVEFTEMELALA